MRTQQPNYLKRGKTLATKSWLVLGLHLIGWESDTSFFGPITEWSDAKPMQSRITSDTQKKIALFLVVSVMLKQILF